MPRPTLLLALLFPLLPSAPAAAQGWPDAAGPERDLLTLTLRGHERVRAGVPAAAVRTPAGGAAAVRTDPAPPRAGRAPARP